MILKSHETTGTNLFLKQPKTNLTKSISSLGSKDSILLAFLVFLLVRIRNGNFNYYFIRMENHAEISPAPSETDNDLKIEPTKNLIDRPDSPVECSRSETPSSDASTSGVCSMMSSDFESSEENIEEKQESENEMPTSCPVIIYDKRNILDMFENIHPFSVFQTTYVPKMNMSNYWERRSIYHRLGPYGKLDELDFQKCFLCDFYTTVPKRL